MKTLLLLLVLVTFAMTSSLAQTLGSKVIFAVNAGGPRHLDMYGVQYQEDTLVEGIVSDHGKRYDIKRAPAKDHILYQTERYGLSSFGYDIPVKEDGDYVIVLKFCEVYFRSPRQKVFDVVLNNEHLVISELDIFREVGIATAHDEYIQVKVKNQGKTLNIEGTESSISGGRIHVKFAKGAADNPKINALYVIKGTINDVPKLPLALPEPDLNEDTFEDDEEYEDSIMSEDEDIAFSPQDLGIPDNYRLSKGTGKSARRSGSRHFDPWEMESNFNKYLPITATLTMSVVSFVLVYSIVSVAK